MKLRQEYKCFKYYDIRTSNPKNIDVFIFPIELSKNTPVSIQTHNQEIYLVGDACFISHFFSGQGVNSGFREVDYLIPNIHHKNIYINYREFVLYELKNRWKRYPFLIIPFEDIDKSIKLLSKKLLEQIADFLNTNVNGLTKKEIAYIIGCGHIPKCINNKWYQMDDLLELFYD